MILLRLMLNHYIAIYCQILAQNFKFQDEISKKQQQQLYSFFVLYCKM